VEGELFHRGAVQALAPEETEVMPRLAALVRRDLEVDAVEDGAPAEDSAHPRKRDRCCWLLHPLPSPA
jgi:hypothetical protein